MHDRILIDDLNTTGSDALLLRLALVKTIVMRMFKPLAGDRDSALSRVLNSLGEASRVQQRMHNKLFIADTNNQAIRVCDLKTGTVSTLPVEMK